VSVPDYIEIDTDATEQDIRDLLQEAKDKRVSDKSWQMLLTLSFIEPAYRLALNMKKTLNMMAERRVSADILADGLTDSEKAMLVELDQRYLSPDARRTARCLLNVKERWLLRKSTYGLFSAARCSSAFLELADDEA